MDERGIIIADRDGEFRRQMAQFFESAGYAVETTDSAVHVLCSILEKKTPVLLLGSDFDRKISSADLIHLLKKCNRHLHVIMVSDDIPLPQARRIREEGIFYHALKPASTNDTEEIGLAVSCAFEKGIPGRQGAGAGVRQGFSGSVRSRGERSAVRTMGRLAALVAVVFATSYLSLLAAEKASRGDSMGIWIFLAFCAAIVATQILPIFRVRLPGLRRRAKRREEAKQRG